MTLEQLVLYLFVAGVVLLQLVSRELLRRRERDAEAESALHPTEGMDDGWRNPPPRPRNPETVEALPALAARSHAPDRAPARPRPKRPVPPPRAPAPARSALQHRAALRDRAELRRAIELMAILGPPRSRVPDDY